VIESLRAPSSLLYVYIFCMFMQKISD
jgi:hypothetical protein